MTDVRLRYEPQLDGVRAIAILAVAGYHCFPESLEGGFAGVDVFFVLSGYLITSVILSGLEEKVFSLQEFYLRRIQRLLPNAVAMMLATVLLSCLILGPGPSVQTARHSLWALLNLSNVFAWRYLGSYWDDAGEFSPLLHTWSLAVEEQFYLLFPVVLLALHRRSRRLVVSALGFLAAASLLASMVVTRTDPAAAFYLLPTRAWQLLLGAILAVFLQKGALDSPRPAVPASAREAAGWAGLIGIAATAFLVSGRDTYPGVGTLAPALATALVLFSVSDRRTTAARILSLPPLVRIGQASYSVYLWHWPGLVLGRLVSEVDGLPRRQSELAGVAAGIVIAAVSYRLVEQPLRRRGPGRRRRLAAIAAGFSVCVIVCAVLSLRPTTVDREAHFDAPAFSVPLYDASGISTTADLREKPAYADMRVPPPRPGPPDPWRYGGVVHAWGGGAPRVVLLGSSHANMYGCVVDDVCRRLGLSVAFYGADGTSPIFGRTLLRHRLRLPTASREFEEARNRWILAWKPDVVIVVDKWDDHEIEGFENGLEAFVSGLRNAAPAVVLVTQVPALDVGERLTLNVRDLISRQYTRLGRRPRVFPDAREAVRIETARIMESLSSRRPGVRVLRADRSFYAKDGSVRYSEGRTFFYADRGHLSDEGARSLTKPFHEAIATACESRPVSRPAAGTTSKNDSRGEAPTPRQGVRPAPVRP
jgi:peptidoglycan/LPS O-acetylase OafA/YrhL